LYGPLKQFQKTIYCIPTGQPHTVHVICYQTSINATEIVLFLLNGMLHNIYMLGFIYL